MKEICFVCEHKKSCSFLRVGNIESCEDVQKSQYGYNEAVRNAREFWLKAFSSCLPIEMQDWGFRKIDEFERAIKEK